jgi:hypothetical protein
VCGPDGIDGASSGNHPTPQCTLALFPREDTISMLNFKSSYRCVFLCLVVAGVVLSPASARAGMVGILVPAYFYPGTGGAGGSGDGWAQMATASATVPVTAIFNPASGPGVSMDPVYAAAMTNLEKAGGHVVAYVFSGGGSVSLASVEAQINTYITQYGSLINGFFIDGMNVLPSTLSYYQAIDSYIKSLGSSYTVVGNPGQPFQNGVATSDYLSTADVLNIFEGPNVATPPSTVGFDAYPYGLNWFLSPPSNRFSNIVFDVPTDSAMLADLNKATQLNAGNVYFTDQTLPNPYSQLPSYWDQEVAAIHSLPEPGTLTYLASAVLCWPLAVAARGRVRRRSRA